MIFAQKFFVFNFLKVKTSFKLLLKGRIGMANFL